MKAQARLARSSAPKHVLTSILACLMSTCRSLPPHSAKIASAAVHARGDASYALLYDAARQQLISGSGHGEVAYVLSISLSRARAHR